MVEQTRGITSQTEAPKHPRLRVFVQALIALGAIGTLGALALFPLDWEDQAIVGGALLGLAWILHRCSSSRTTTLALVVISTFTTVRYLWWRFAETFSYLRYNAGQEGWADLLFVSLLLGAETYAFFVLALGYFQSINPLKRKPVPLPEDTDEWPSVDVLIPTYNEPLSVLKPTVLAAMNMDWPRDRMRVIVLDDGLRRDCGESSTSPSAAASNTSTGRTTASPKPETSTTPCATPRASSSRSSIAITSRPGRSCR